MIHDAGIAAVLIATSFFPNGQGILTQLTPVGAAANWDCVNEPVANDLADYVESPGVDGVVLTDLYEVRVAKGLRGHIQSVELSLRMQAVDLIPFPFTSTAVEMVVADGAMISEGLAIFVPINGIWTDSSVVLPNNPITKNLWRKEELNRMQFGLRVHASSEQQARITRLAVSVNTTDPNDRIPGRAFQRWDRTN